MAYILYQARNKYNGKIYLGITCKSLYHRKKSHYNDARARSNHYFHRAIRKYGESAFEWDVVLTRATKEEITFEEQFHIAAIGTRKDTVGYNTTLGGDGGWGMQVTSETRKKISEAAKRQYDNPEVKAKCLNALRTPEARANHRIAIGKRWEREEERQRQSEMSKARWVCPVVRKWLALNASTRKPIICLQNNVMYSSIHAAAKALGLSRPNIGRVLKGEYKQTQGYSFKYASKEGEGNGQ